jgi:hypothetical protein
MYRDIQTVRLNMYDSVILLIFCIEYILIQVRGTLRTLLTLGKSTLLCRGVPSADNLGVLASRRVYVALEAGARVQPCECECVDLRQRLRPPPFLLTISLSS